MMSGLINLGQGTRFSNRTMELVIEVLLMTISKRAQGRVRKPKPPMHGDNSSLTLAVTMDQIKS